MSQSVKKSTCKEENCHPFWLMMAFFTFSPFLDLFFAGHNKEKLQKIIKVTKGKKVRKIRILLKVEVELKI